MDAVFGADTERTAAKTHKCFLCERGIYKGNKYFTREGISDGSHWRMKMHAECRHYANEALGEGDWEEIAQWTGTYFIDEMDQWYNSQRARVND